LLITMRSVTGCTITVTVAVPDKLLVALVPVTVKVKDCAGVSSGTLGAVKVTLAPVVEDNPVAGDHVKVTSGAALAGSTAVASSDTTAPLATVMVVPVTVGGGGGRFGSTTAGFGPVAKALTAGGVFGAGTTIGTTNGAVAD